MTIRAQRLIMFVMAVGVILAGWLLPDDLSAKQYLVVDLSGGPEAEQYPTVFLDSVPAFSSFTGTSPSACPKLGLP